MDFKSYFQTAKFGNFGSKVSFIAENPHLIESNARSKLEIRVDASQTGLPRKGGDLDESVHWKQVVKRFIIYYSPPVVPHIK
jgi:hypothetical protein